MIAERCVDHLQHGLTVMMPTQEIARLESVVSKLQGDASGQQPDASMDNNAFPVVVGSDTQQEQ